MKFSKPHELPWEWKKTLAYCTDFATWFVFSDWLEEHGGNEIARGVRWLAKQKRMPSKVPKGWWRLNWADNRPGRVCYRWWWYDATAPYWNMEHSEIGAEALARLPCKCRIMPNTTVYRYSKWTATILKSYLAAARAVYEEWKAWDNGEKTKIPGVLPGWLKDF